MEQTRGRLEVGKEGRVQEGAKEDQCVLYSRSHSSPYEAISGGSGNQVTVSPPPPTLVTISPPPPTVVKISPHPPKLDTF